MACSLHQNPSFLKPLRPSATPTTTTPRRSSVQVRCGGPRSQRGPLVKGRILSIEAIQAIQTLKRIQRTNPPNLSHLLSNTLTRLIKSDLLATLRELLRQQQCTLALQVFSALRSEYGAELSLYADMVQALAIAGMNDEVDRLILDVVGSGIQVDDTKGLLSLIKALIGAQRRESLVTVYELMKESGWGSGVEPDEYVVKVLVNGLKNFGELDLAQQIQDEFDRFYNAKSDNFVKF